MSAQGNKTESRKRHKSGSSYEYGSYITLNNVISLKCGIIKYNIKTVCRPHAAASI